LILITTIAVIPPEVVRCPFAHRNRIPVNGIFFGDIAVLPGIGGKRDYAGNGAGIIAQIKGDSCSVLIGNARGKIFKIYIKNFLPETITAYIERNIGRSIKGRYC